jgi:TRAP-type transport system periplasmic protein
MKRLQSWAIPIAAIALACADVRSATAQVLPSGPREAVVQAAGSYPADHITTQAMQRLASSVATTTSGQLQIEIVPDAGSVEQLTQQLETGDPAIIWVDLATFSRFAPELRALTLPFVMPSRERAFEIIEGPVVDLIEVWLQARNLVVLGYMDAGNSPLFTTAGPIRTIEDLQGLAIGVRDEVRADAYRLVGAEPTIMPTAEAFDALEQNQIQAIEAPYQALLANLPPETQGHLSGVIPIVDYVIVVANRERWQNLVLDHQRITELAARNAVIFERGASAIAEQSARTQLEARGIVLEAPSDELNQQLWEAAAGLVEETRKEAGPAFVDGIIAEARGPGGPIPPVR